MKRVVFVLILAMITIISCAKEKDKKSNNTGISTDPYATSTVTGYFNQSNSQQPIEVSGVLYAVSPQTNTQIIMQALQQAQINRITPLYINGQPKYRARMTVSRYLNNYQQNGQQYNQQYPQQYQQPQQLSNILTISSIQFY